MESLPSHIRHIAIVLCVLIPATLVNLFLVRFYREQRAGHGEARGWSWIARWNFSARELGRSTYRQLALASVLSLFLELLMIRWVSSEVRVFAYFKNFVLVACFLGFGVGCYLCRRAINLLAFVTPLLAVALLIKWPWGRLRILMSSLPTYIGALSDVQMWGVPKLGLGWYSLAVVGAAVALIVTLFALIAFVFIPLGQFVGWYLENTKEGVWGYTVNILGSLVGIGFYTVLCFLDQPPTSWFVAAGALAVALLWTNTRVRWASAAAFAACAALASFGPGAGSTTYWSPYQKLTLTPQREPGTSEVIYYDLNTNDAWYQKILNLSPEFVRGHAGTFRTTDPDWNAYNLPYHFYPQPPEVLVLGAGMGNDVAAALRHGAKRVVAVEIDPLIIDLGRRLHFEKPYDSPAVRIVVDDARSYIQNSGERFDLIMFSLLDSHTTTSSYSNIRIDNYVYTVEAMRAARSLLKPGGLFIVKFQVDTPWISGRLQNLLAEVFGRVPVQVQTDAGGYTTPGRFFILGAQERIERALEEPALAAYYASHGNFETAAAEVTTDDWPYFYQHERGIPTSVLLVSLVLMALGWLFLRETGVSVTSLRWHFFFLGAGFLLLEAQIISKMALLFGTTWVVNSIVISGLLLLIVASNLLVERRPNLRIEFAYAGIFASMLVGFLMPMERVLLASIWLRALAATAVLCLPVFFAGIVFIRSFAQAGFRGEALGSNLLGALFGGLLESLSFWTGIRSLLVVAFILYAASWLTIHRVSVKKEAIAA